MYLSSQKRHSDVSNISIFSLHNLLAVCRVSAADGTLGSQGAGEGHGFLVFRVVNLKMKKCEFRLNHFSNN